MIVLDTDVLSELMRTRADLRVVTWLDRQPADTVWTTAICVFEIRLGLELLAPGSRKRNLESAFDRMIETLLEGRVLPFDNDAARLAATHAARRQSAGQSLDFRDLEISGIVSSRRATIATRNVRHFTDLGIDVVNPWQQV